MKVMIRPLGVVMFLQSVNSMPVLRAIQDNLQRDVNLCLEYRNKTPVAPHVYLIKYGPTLRNPQPSKLLSMSSFAPQTRFMLFSIFSRYPYLRVSDFRLRVEQFGATARFPSDRQSKRHRSEDRHGSFPVMV